MTINEYILEQDISSATCSDIEIEQAFAEMSVLSEMCRCYEKAQMFAEYASEPSVVTSCGIFMESDTDAGANEEKKKKTFKEYIVSIGKVISGLWGKFLDIFKNIFSSQMMKILNKMPADTIIYNGTNTNDSINNKMSGIVIFAEDINATLEMVSDFTNAVKSSDVETIKKFAEPGYVNSMRVEKVKESRITHNNPSIITKESMIAIVDQLNQAKTYSKAKNLMSQISSIADNGDINIDVSLLKSAVKNISTQIKEVTDSTYRIYNLCIKTFDKNAKSQSKYLHSQAAKDQGFFSDDDDVDDKKPPKK